MKPDESKRNSLLIATSAIALVAGIGVNWWQINKESEAFNQSSQNNLSPNIWEQVFDTPDGMKLNLASLRSKPLLINFWATWCPPCVEELPLLNRFFVENHANGIQILGLAVDKTDAVTTFLRKTPLSFPIAITGASGISLSKSWGNLSAGLPFSLILDANGRIMQRKMGQLNSSDLSTWLTALDLKKTKQPTL